MLSPLLYLKRSVVEINGNCKKNIYDVKDEKQDKNSRLKCDSLVSHFRIVRLSILSVPALCLKDPQKRNDTIHPEILLTVGVIHWNKVIWVLATQKQEELSVNN